MDSQSIPAVAAIEQPAPKKRGRPAKKRPGVPAAPSTTLGDNKITKVASKAAKKNPPGRRKKAAADDLKTQLRYDRMFELKCAYRELSALIKPGLQMLLDRSLESMEQDSEVHTRVPEYSKVIAGLDAKRQAREAQLRKEYEIRTAYLKKQFDMQRDYANRLFEVRLLQLQNYGHAH
jgi:LPS O-antigen subunit length determinant protein (WzzB/FepE family)